jgi:hypothetical protein
VADAVIEARISPENCPPTTVQLPHVFLPRARGAHTALDISKAVFSRSPARVDASSLPLPPPFGHPAPHEAPQRHQRLVGEAVDQLVELLAHLAYLVGGRWCVHGESIPPSEPFPAPQPLTALASAPRHGAPRDARSQYRTLGGARGREEPGGAWRTRWPLRRSPPWSASGILFPPRET